METHRSELSSWTQHFTDNSQNSIPIYVIFSDGTKNTINLLSDLVEQWSTPRKSFWYTWQIDNHLSKTVQKSVFPPLFSPFFLPLCHAPPSYLTSYFLSSFSHFIFFLSLSLSLSCSFLIHSLSLSFSLSIYVSLKYAQDICIPNYRK